MESDAADGYCPLRNAYDSVILGALGKGVNGLPEQTGIGCLARSHGKSSMAMLGFAQ
jgi:hypothetical protein